MTYVETERKYQDALSFLMRQYNRVWDGNEWVINCQVLEFNTHFSPQELGVLKLMGDGETDKEIAETLSISYQTAKNYVMSIRNKLGTKNRCHSIIKAIKMGLVKL
jgi:DNA-binding NarL/FixJ family response regulator